MVRAGVVSSLELSIQLHRRLFRDICRTSKWSPSENATLDNVLCVGNIDARVASLGGKPMVCNLGLASKSKLTLIHDVVSHIYTMGGITQRGEVSGSIERFSPVTGQWEMLPLDMPMSAVHHAAAMLQGRIFLVGMGRRERGGAVITFNPCARANKAWQGLGGSGMQVKRVSTTACAVHGKLYVCGGLDSSTFEPCSSVECLSPTIDMTWETLPPMRIARVAARSVALAGHLLVCGGHGSDYPQSITSSSEIFDPIDQVWSAAPKMTIPRVYHSAAQIAGTVYVCGGFTSHTFPYAAQSAEFYRPADRKWQPLPNLLQPRASAAVGVLCQSMYVFGGEIVDDNYSQPCKKLSSVERYNSHLGVWELLQPMSEPRAGHAAFVVSTG